MITEPNEFIQRLQELQDSSSVTYSTLPSNEPRFIIDANSRTIKIPPEFQFLGVKNDHKAETVYFEIDRYFDNEDLSTHTCVVQFENKSGEGGIYPVTIMDTESVDGKIIFGWEIMSDATTIVGDIIFSVRFYSLDNYVFTYNFNTLPAKSVILDTLNVDDPTVVENYPSELEAWLDRMNDLSQNVVKPEDVELLDTKMNTLETSFGKLETNVNSSVDELKSDLINITGNKPFTNFIKNKFINLSGTTTDYSEASATNGFSYCIVDCSKNDVFTISGTGGVSARLYGFVDASGNIIYKADENVTLENDEIVAPKNAVKLVVNLSPLGGTLYKNSLIKNQVNKLSSNLNSITEKLNLLDESNKVLNKIIDSSGSVITDNGGVYYEQFIEVQSGDYYTFYTDATGSVTFRVYYFDENKSLLDRPIIKSEIAFVIPETVKYISIQTVAKATVNKLFKGNKALDFDYCALDYIARQRIDELTPDIPTLNVLDKVYPIYEPTDVTDEFARDLGYDNVILDMPTEEFLSTYYDKFIYQAYDDYKVEKRSLGQDSANSYYEMFYYIFEPKNYSKTILLSSGMNTCELNALFGLAYFVDSLMNSDDEGMQALKRTTRFIVLPLICPSSFDKSPKNYLNANGVRINKNFNYLKSWDVVNCNGRGTKGTSPDSEEETKALKQWLNKYTGSALWIDCHGDLTITDPNLFAAVSSSESVKTKITPCMRNMKAFYKSKGYFTDSDPAYVVNYVEDGSSYPKTLYSEKVCGVPAIMIEQYAGTTVYGGTGTKQCEGAAIKNYVTMISQYCMAMLVD